MIEAHHHSLRELRCAIYGPLGLRVVGWFTGRTAGLEIDIRREEKWGPGRRFAGRAIIAGDDAAIAGLEQRLEDAGVLYTTRMSRAAAEG